MPASRPSTRWDCARRSIGWAWNTTDAGADLAVTDDVKQAVLGYLGARGEIPGDSEQEQLEFNFVDSGFIDSLGIVEMVTALEDRFGVRFEPEDLQAEEFRTPGGVVA